MIGWFVTQQQSWLLRKGSGYIDALTLAPGQSLDKLVGILRRSSLLKALVHHACSRVRP